MPDFKGLFQNADWKQEKHAPVIEAPAVIQKGEPCQVKVTVGKEVPHPNTAGHHIRWIEVYFLAEGEKFPYQIGRFEFGAHGESAQGPDTSSIYSQPALACSFKTEKSGTIFASSYCNIHGLWQGALKIEVG